jgi:hypothetical protein
MSGTGIRQYLMEFTDGIRWRKRTLDMVGKKAGYQESEGLEGKQTSGGRSKFLQQAGKGEKKRI